MKPPFDTLEPSDPVADPVTLVDIGELRRRVADRFSAPEIVEMLCLSSEYLVDLLDDRDLTDALETLTEYL